MLYWNIYSLWPRRISRRILTATQQRASRVKSWATEANRKFLRELDWIVVYYLFTDILRTFILLLYCTPEHSAAVPESLQLQREQSTELSASPLSLAWKTHSFLMWFSASPSPELTHSEVRWAPVTRGKWQGSTAREVGAENGTTTLFQQRPAPKP